MQVSDFDYILPSSLIAQSPAEPRDHARLLVYLEGRIEHRHFYNLTEYLQSGDVLVLNDSKVFPARLIGRRVSTGGKMEVFLLRPQDDYHWECLVGHGRVQAGQIIELSEILRGELIQKKDKHWLVRFNLPTKKVFEEAEKIGQTPLPPYIKTVDDPSIRDRYQTVYAHNPGSAAAPTAGLHFTSELLDKVRQFGVDIETVSLHVGLGTFAPLQDEVVEENKLHSEFYTVSPEAWERLKLAQTQNRRIIAVGTTTARVLESVAMTEQLSGSTDIFIYPGYEFKMIDGLITNFHLPKSSLLMLVSAWLQHKYDKDGLAEIQRIYKQAVDKEYRFFSFGDAMML
ncbi:MAG: tRNA preQ1(34) S-adenosylmethionine ribosyltransferase-isomerase QueA [Candidatus Komeilibacteria bacterium]|nr:tRNA preQ1(34) S-adenosylmethionine ribosyltransferase-isomerase QueA [Candidatus Komeilibacteria bacterium]